MANGQDKPKKEEKTPVTFSLPQEIYDKMVDRLPRYGARSRVCELLWKKFLDGEIQLTESY